MRVAVVNTKVPFVRGGAEDLADELVRTLRAAGHEVDLIELPFQWDPPERVLEHMLAVRLLDLRASMGTPIDRVIALRFPAWLIEHPHRTVWLIHQHKWAFEDWEDERHGGWNRPGASSVRAAVVRADREFLAGARRFAISGAVARRLERTTGLDAEVLTPLPSGFDGFHSGEDGGYVLVPGRLSDQKRQELVLRAAAHAGLRLPLRVVGTADAPDFAARLERLARELGIAERVEWLGQRSRDEMIELYANARAVAIPSRAEDLGYVALEALRSRKPVVTCTDSEGPLDFVRHGENGWIVEPRVEAFAEALARLERPREHIAPLNAAAFDHATDSLRPWPDLAERLLS